MENEKPLPQLLKIGNHDYVVSQEYDGYLGGANLLGECSYTNTEIRVASKTPQTRKEEVFVHEVVHALLHEAGLAEEVLNDEKLVQPLGMVLYRLLRENDFNFLYQGPKTKSAEAEALKSEAEAALEALNIGSYTRAAALIERLAGVVK